MFMIFSKARTMSENKRRAGVQNIYLWQEAAGLQETYYTHYAIIGISVTLASLQFGL